MDIQVAKEPRSALIERIRKRWETLLFPNLPIRCRFGKSKDDPDYVLLALAPFAYAQDKPLSQQETDK